MSGALAAMAYRRHVALAPRAAAAAAAASRPRLVGRARRPPAGRSLALRVEMRVEGGRLRRVEGGGWRRVEEEGPGQEGGGARGRDHSRGRTEAPRDVSISSSPMRRDPAPSRRTPGLARISNKQLNSNISRAGSVEAILELVDEHHKTFNYINVTTAVTRIANLTREQRRSGSSNAVIQDVPLASDERYVCFLGSPLCKWSVASRLNSTTSCFWEQRWNESPPT